MTPTFRGSDPDPERSPAAELRDTERLIALWHKKANELGVPPPASAFDFSPIMGGDWGFRFLMCADTVTQDHAFLLYGSQFAVLMELPAHPVPHLRIIRQLPDRHLQLFTEGCSEAVKQAMPIRMSGAVPRDFGRVELYRAAFVPLGGAGKSPTPLVLGTFNCRISPNIHAADVFRQTHNWIGEDMSDGKSRVLM
jgi:hypothetical protein